MAEVHQVALCRRRGILAQVHHVQGLRDNLLPGDAVVVQDLVQVDVGLLELGIEIIRVEELARLVE